jgi:hypothetical protein
LTERVSLSVCETVGAGSTVQFEAVTVGGTVVAPARPPGPGEMPTKVMSPTQRLTDAQPMVTPRRTIRPISLPPPDLSLLSSWQASPPWGQYTLQRQTACTGSPEARPLCSGRLRPASASGLHTPPDSPQHRDPSGSTTMPPIHGAHPIFLSAPGSEVAVRVGRSHAVGAHGATL